MLGQVDPGIAPRPAEHGKPYLPHALTDAEGVRSLRARRLRWLMALTGAEPRALKQPAAPGIQTARQL